MRNIINWLKGRPRTPADARPTQRRGVSTQVVPEMGKIEVLARAWIDCDPNRQPADPDELMTEMSGDLKDQPRWKWFVPRAEALDQYLEARGYRIMRVHVGRHPLLAGIVEE